MIGKGSGFALFATTTLTFFMVGLSACGASGTGASGTGGASNSSPAATSLVAKIWETDVDQTKLLAPQPDATFSDQVTDSTVITVDASQTYQSMVGFGAAVTDASAYVIRHDLSGSQRDALMSDLFGPSGIGLSFLRLTIGASDFSRSHYTYDDVSSGTTDLSLSQFSIAPATTDVIPVVKEALANNGHLSLMASPWSAPAWMKSTGSLYRGSLNPTAYGAYAAYLSKYVQAMASQGIAINYLTLQNEPGFEPADYPGMSVPPATRALFIGSFLGPKFSADSVSTKILDYDHNWDLPSSPSAVLADKTASTYVAGIAWHCYAGDVSAQTAVHNAYPSKDTFFTECSGTFPTDFGGSFDWNMKNLVIGAPQNWAKSVLLWNLALDENNGPHLGGCATCRGVVTINSATGAVTKNLEYYALAHASKFVRPGALRIASNTSAGIDTVAFKNADDGSIVLIALNTNAVRSSFSIKWAASAFSYSLPAGAAATFVWKP